MRCCFKIISALVLLQFFSMGIHAREEYTDVRNGNKLYKAEKYVEAEIEYRKGIQKNPKSFEASYNLGNSLFKQKKYPEALEQYQRALALQSTDKKKMAAALHNTGNALLSQNKIQESIDAYKMALKTIPNDNETKYNLAYAMMMLKNQQQNQDKSKENEEKQKQEEQQQQQQQQQQNMSKQSAEQILNALMQDEKRTLEKAKKQQVRGRKSSERDW